MSGITNNETIFVLSIFKSPEKQYNASSLAKHIGISRMGALKIARKLEKERIISSMEMGKAKFYKLNFENNYVKSYIKFLLSRESELAHAYVKVWIEDIRKIKNADAAILFGSVLIKHKEARDIDVALIMGPKKFKKVLKEIEEINKMHMKRLHPIHLAKGDLAKNLKKGNEAMFEVVKGITVFGEDLVIKEIIDYLPK